MSRILQARSQSQFFDALGEILCEPPLQIRVLVAGSQLPVSQVAFVRAPFDLRIEARDDFTIGRFNYLAGTERFKGEVAFCTSRFDGIIYLISVCSGAVWDRAVMRLARHMYHDVVPVFFSQQEMQQLLKLAKTIFSDARLDITGHVRKKRLKRGTRRKYESSRTRTERALEAVFNEAEEQNFWFQSVSFEYLRESSESISDPLALAGATLSKYGTLFCNSHFDRFFHSVIHEMSNIACKKMAFFGNRSRRLTQSFQAKPITITFPSPAFRSSDDNQNFIGILRKMPSASCSVLHSNPYVHLSVSELEDGSGTDLWVLKDDEVLLVPQLKASEAALKRLVNYIFEEWREGEVGSAVTADNAVRPQPPSA